MRAARHVGRLQDGLVEPNQSATFVEDTWRSQSQTRADPEPNNRRWGCRQRDTLEQQRQIITVSEMGREVKTSILMKLAPKQMHMCLQLDTARLNTCEAQDEIESFAFAIESVQNPDVAPMELDAINHRGKGKLSSVQKQREQTVLERARNRSKANVKIVRANTTKSEQLVHVIGVAETDGISWLIACQSHRRRPQKY